MAPWQDEFVSPAPGPGCSRCWGCSQALLLGSSFPGRGSHSTANEGKCHSGGDECQEPLQDEGDGAACGGSHSFLRGGLLLAEISGEGRRKPGGERGEPPGGGTASEKALNQDSAWCIDEGDWGGGSVENREWTRGAGAPGPPGGGQGTSLSTLLSLLPDFSIATTHVYGDDHFNKNEARRMAALS